MESQVVRHALLLIFEYRPDYITARKGVAIEPPNQLLAMNTDLSVAYKLATEKFGIDRKNITVVTDVVPPKGQSRPWDPLRPTGNPRIVQLPYPEITYIIREIAQFIENTIRGIDDIVSKGRDVTNEVFIYVSGHGAQVPSIPGETGEMDPMDNALIFMTRRGDKYYERRYLRANDIFRLFFGHNHVEDDGCMSVPITRRTKINPEGDGKLVKSYYSFEDDEICRFKLTPVKSVNPLSKRADYKAVSGRGLPIGTNMLVVFDTCHSGSMADFHYVYDPVSANMLPTFNLPSGFTYPYCVSLSASEDTSDAPSTSRGSPFTCILSDIFNESRCGMSIKEFHQMIYRVIPKMLRICKPTICSTINNQNQIMPFLTHLVPCELTTDNVRPRVQRRGTFSKASILEPEDQD
jgi:hypothetical protein